VGTFDGLHILTREVDDTGKGSAKGPGRPTDSVHAAEDSGLFGFHIAEAPREEPRADKQAESHDRGRERWPEQWKGRELQCQTHLLSEALRAQLGPDRSTRDLLSRSIHCAIPPPNECPQTCAFASPTASIQWAIVRAYQSSV
jgi:hypothetical protein